MLKKNVVFTLILLALCAFLGYNLWKNKNTVLTGDGEMTLEQKMARSSDGSFNNVAVDTAPGYKGCDRAGMYQYGEKGRQYVYQKFTIKVSPRTDEKPGEKIDVVPSEGGQVWEVPVPEAGKFIGVYRDFMLVEILPEKGDRELLFVDLKDKRGSYKTVVVDTPSIIGGKLWFHAPIPEAEMSKTPDCPNKSDWESKGKKTAYGQKTLYDFSNGSVTKKSEYMCYGQ